ncbi:hypothetical protein DFH11DRAFT_578753 [Phellopilus nigrolimitatus]|nr:hypothetical protein DFH11DRAFT_578753 [Phellopilus nigrolimitatus]
MINPWVFLMRPKVLSNLYTHNDKRLLQFPMSSGTPPMTHVTTKYEDIPPRFRKLWIKGNEERVQKKLNVPIEDFSFSVPLQKTSSESNLPRSLETRSTRSMSLNASEAAAEITKSHLPVPKRFKIDGSVLSENPDDRSGDIGRGGSFVKGKERPLSLPIAYSGSPAMQRIIDSVVDMNIARTTPPPSRCNSPAANPSAHSKYRAPSRSRPVTRPSSPNSGIPAPTGWTALTSRHSLRRFDIRRGDHGTSNTITMRHARNFRERHTSLSVSTDTVPPKGVVKFKAPPPDALPSMSDLRKIPEFQKASRRLDRADHALEEALLRGQTWDNTPVPKEYFQFSLEDSSPEDIRTGRPNNTAVQDRSRSSVTLEEEANLIDTSRPGENSSISRSSTFIHELGCASASDPSFASSSASVTVAPAPISVSAISRIKQEAMIVDEDKPFESTSASEPLQTTYDGDSQSGSSAPSAPSSMSPIPGPFTVTTTPTQTQTSFRDSPFSARASASSQPPETSPDPDITMPSTQLVRKRLLEEIYDYKAWSDSSSLSPPPTRSSSPGPPQTGLTRVSPIPDACSTSGASGSVPAPPRSRTNTPLSRSSSARRRRRGLAKR